MTVLLAWLFLGVVLAWVFSAMKRRERRQRRAALVAVAAELGRFAEYDSAVFQRCLDSAARDIYIARTVNEWAHPAAHVLDVVNRRTSWRPRTGAQA